MNFSNLYENDANANGKILVCLDTINGLEQSINAIMAWVRLKVCFVFSSPQNFLNFTFISEFKTNSNNYVNFIPQK